MVKPTKMSFEERYSDDSGDEFAVRCDTTKTCVNGEIGVVEFEHIGEIDFPLSKLDWIIDCLQKIKAEVAK
jgi:hypothetical protein